MAFASFTTKAGDTKPLRVRLQKLDDAGAYVPAPIAGGTVQFHMRNQAGQSLINAAAVIVDAPNGIVEYQFASPSQTAAAGKYRAEFAVTYTGGVVETFPADGYILVNIIGTV